MDLLILLWAVLGAFTGAVAASKGRSLVGWFLLGALFPLIALIAVAAMPAIKRAQGRQKKCPECAESVMAEALVCKHCGYRFSGPTVPDDQGQLDVTQDLRTLVVVAFLAVFTAGYFLIAKN